MLDVDSFNNILAIVRTCVKANRADLIENALINRQHVGEVAARIESERAAGPPAESRSLFLARKPDITAEDVHRANEARLRLYEGR